MNGPTKLTLMRIALVPFLLVFAYMGTPWNSWVSLGIFLIASITDWLDGYLARRNNQVTILGKLLDPLADKLLVLTAFLVILERNLIPTWLVILFIGREMGITGLRSFLAAEGIVLSAGQMGKWKMVFQVIALSFLFVGDTRLFGDIWFWYIGIVSASIALVLSLVSAWLYIRKFWTQLGDKIMAEQQQKGKPS